MRPVSSKEISERLWFDNPWWESGTIDPRFQDLPKRFYFSSFFKHTVDRSVNRAVISMGPRRVGKTVMVYQAVERLIARGINPQHIVYASLETPLYTGLSLEKVLRLFQEIHGHQRAEELFVFFDEIQYLKDWEIHLKSLVDSFPSVKFIATGSAAAALRLKSRESGAGRFTYYLLPPLKFAEYLNFIGLEGELFFDFQEERSNAPDIARAYRCTDIEKLNGEFINYLNYGGYPEAVFSRTIQQNSTQFIKSDIIDKVLLRDLPSLYGISDIQELNRLFTTLAYNSGNELTLEELASSSGVAKNTLKRYLEYLEATFLIKKVNRIDDTAKRFKRAASFKVYLTNPSMRAALFGYVVDESEAMGLLTETAIYSQWLHTEAIGNLHYARWKKGEVDFVYLDPIRQKPSWCVEVKWTDRPARNNELLRNVVYFARKNDLAKLRVTTKTLTHHKEIDGIEIELIPAAEYAYLLGKSTFAGAD
ncbi:MAG: ATP-binding protein [Deltaproteobacteria bacterium]|nr:ATP-binding protein [Deltaproteobacteria bacterium]